MLASLWAAARRGDLTLVLSELALSEALVAPLRFSNANAVTAYEAIANETGFLVKPVTWRVLRRAAELRAQRTALRTPDAIHVATADLALCDAFVTNDKSLRSAPLANVIVMDDVV